MEYQHGIIGGGCAGLQMLYALLRTPETSKQRIIIFEAECTIPNKSWCFWSDKDNIYQNLVEKSWPALIFRAEDHVIRQSILPYHYQYISSQRFYQFHHELIRNHENVTLVYTKPQQLKAVNNGFELIAGDQIYQLKSVYDSRLQPKKTEEKPLLQHFLGWHVQTEVPIFDTTAPIVMDFDVAGNGFVYLLPFSSCQALIELTHFSSTLYQPEHYHFHLQKFMALRYPQVNFQIKFEERGKIPMSREKFTGVGAAGQWLIGTAGGMTKATTGYTFGRITKDCAQIAAAVAAGKPVAANRGTTGRFLFYDRLLLGILERKPALLQKIMYQLFSKQPFNRILAFLDESSSFWQELKIFCSLPWTPFLKQLFLYRKNG